MFEFPKAKSIVVSGDIHGEFTRLVYKCCVQYGMIDTVVKACGHTILCVGGATSIDRTYRMSSKNFHFQKADEPLAPNVYWPDESPVYDQTKLAAINEVCAIDTAITHTSPSFCELSSHQGLQTWAIRDEDLIDDVKRERKVMDDILGYLYAKNHPLQYWYYGHFHQSWHCEIDGVQYNMLDCMELREIFLSYF